MPRAVRVIAGVTGVLFLLGVIVQFNDPDPLRWVAIYGVAAGACLLAAAGRPLPRPVTLIAAGIAILWAALLSPHVLGTVPFSDLFRDVGMDSVEIEEGREMYGLLLIGGALFLVGFFTRSGRMG